MPKDEQHPTIFVHDDDIENEVRTITHFEPPT
jgi:hypothetical protein